MIVIVLLVIVLIVIVPLMKNPTPRLRGTLRCALMIMRRQMMMAGETKLIVFLGEVVVVMLLMFLRILEEGRRVRLPMFPGEVVVVLLLFGTLLPGTESPDMLGNGAPELQTVEIWKNIVIENI